MKFGKVLDYNLLKNIDFSLPEDRIHPNPSFSKKEGQFKIYVGSPKWGVKEWIGKIYPPKTKAKDFLREYSKSFSSIELNTTHYRVPTIKMVEDWYSQTEDNFLFCPKIPQRISHYGGLTSIPLINEFAEAVRHFKEKLGVVFLQLSENFSPKRGNDLKFFIEHWPSDLRLTIEFRHEEWFLPTNKVWKFMADNNIGSVISDTAGRRDVLHSNLTADFVVVRFVGNNLHESDFSRTDLWVDKIADWKERACLPGRQGIKEIYFFEHEPEDINCPEISDYFIKQVDEKLGIKLQQMQFQNNDPLNLL